MKTTTININIMPAKTIASGLMESLNGKGERRRKEKGEEDEKRAGLKQCISKKDVGNER